MTIKTICEEYQYSTSSITVQIDQVTHNTVSVMVNMSFNSVIMIINYIVKVSNTSLIQHSRNNVKFAISRNILTRFTYFDFSFV